MTKYRLVKILPMVLLLVAIMCAGVFVPFQLLGIQEKSVFGHFTLLSADEGLLTVSGTLNYDDLVERISQWDAAQYNESHPEPEQNDAPGQDDGFGIAVKEASGDDMTMLEAQTKGSEELQLLMNMGLLPEMDLGRFSITGAILYTVEENTDISRWELYYSDHYMIDAGGMDIVISIDSVTGCIYSLRMNSPDGYDMESTLCQLAKNFALYHNIKDITEEKDGCIQTTDGLLNIRAAIEDTEYNLEITGANFLQ